MASVYKVLGQSAPSAASATTLYTVPGATSTVVSSVWVCNRSAVPTSFRLWTAIAAAGDTNAQYIAYDVPIGANESVVLVAGITLAATDLIRIYATLATLSFSAFGEEIS